MPLAICSDAAACHRNLSHRLLYRRQLGRREQKERERDNTHTQSREVQDRKLLNRHAMRCDAMRWTCGAAPRQQHNTRPETKQGQRSTERGVKPRESSVETPSVTFWPTQQSSEESVHDGTVSRRVSPSCQLAGDFATSPLPYITGSLETPTAALRASPSESLLLACTRTMNRW